MAVFNNGLIVTIRSWRRAPSTAGRTMTLRFTEDNLLGQLGAAEVHKGRFVLGDGCVEHVEISADGTRIKGRVAGTRRRPYSQTITLETHGNGKHVLIHG